jgi:endonuclease-3 related protein
MVGSVLTQNTAWSNVEKAIEQLKQHQCLSLDAILATHIDKLATMIRPSGYFNIKAKRLHNLCEWTGAQGGVEVLSQLDTASLRKGLLSVNGIGPETADDIVLYAFDRPVFVVDAYTRRLFGRLGVIDPDLSYADFQQAVEKRLTRDAQLFNEYHALIVRHAKEVCRKNPACEICVLSSHCSYSG